MKKHTEAHDSGTLLEDARELISATTNVAGEKVADVRERLMSAIEKAKQGIRATDMAIQENPYKSIAIAMGAGIILGYLLSSRGSTKQSESLSKLSKIKAEKLPN